MIKELWHDDDSHLSNDEWLIHNMDLCRKYCSLILKARQKAGFTSLKYPVVHVVINRVFNKEFKELMQEECNIVGYGTDIPAIETDWEFPDEYIVEQEGNMWVALDPTRSTWQQEMHDARAKKREEAEARKLSTTQ